MLNPGHTGCAGGAVSNMKLYSTKGGGVAEVTPRLAEAEADVQSLVEANMEALLGVRFLATEYGTGPVHGGRVDSLGIDENGSPVILDFTDRRSARTGSELRQLIDYMSAMASDYCRSSGWPCVAARRPTQGGSC